MEQGERPCEEEEVVSKEREISAEPSPGMNFELRTRNKRMDELWSTQTSDAKSLEKHPLMLSPQTEVLVFRPGLTCQVEVGENIPVGDQDKAEAKAVPNDPPVGE